MLKPKLQNRINETALMKWMGTAPNKKKLHVVYDHFHATDFSSGPAA
jgi:hypothetical protein